MCVTRTRRRKIKKTKERKKSPIVSVNNNIYYIEIKSNGSRWRRIFFHSITNTWTLNNTRDKVVRRRMSNDYLQSGWVVL